MVSLGRICIFIGRRSRRGLSLKGNYDKATFKEGNVVTIQLEGPKGGNMKMNNLGLERNSFRDSFLIADHSNVLA